MEIRNFVFRSEDVIVFDNDVIRVFVPCQPHVHAEYGGHLVIQTKKFRSVCTLFTPEESLHIMAMVQACTEYMMAQLGAFITNNQDNKNWFFLQSPEKQGGKEPRCHIHIYGRSPEEVLYTGPGAQQWGKSLDFPLPDEPGLELGTVWMNYIHPYEDYQIAAIKSELPDYFRRYLRSIAAILQ